MELASVTVSYDGAWWHVKLDIPKEAHDYGITPVQRRFSTLGPIDGYIDVEGLKEIRRAIYDSMYEIVGQLETLSVDEEPTLFDDLVDEVKGDDVR